MKTYEQLLLQAIRFEHPEVIPVSINFLPSVWLKHPDETAEIVEKFRHLFGDRYRDYDYQASTPTTYHTGTHVDEWNCVWSNLEEGMESIVTGHPVPTREDIRTLPLPEPRDGRMPHGLMYLRLLDLRGFEEAMLDFAEEPEELQMLIDKVLEYNLIQLDIRLAKPDTGELVYFGDDLGMQNGLAIGKAKWVKYLYPCFKAMFDRVHKAGKTVYMHTDGCIHEIMPELHRAGADMINPQFRANGLDNLARVCKGKIPINLDLDRQLFPFASPETLRAHVRECVETLYLPEGGLGLSVEIGHDVPPANMEALISAVSEYRDYR